MAEPRRPTTSGVNSTLPAVCRGREDKRERERGGEGEGGGEGERERGGEGERERERELMPYIMFDNSSCSKVLRVANEVSRLRATMCHCTNTHAQPLRVTTLTIPAPTAAIQTTALVDSSIGQAWDSTV